MKKKMCIPHVERVSHRLDSSHKWALPNAIRGPKSSIEFGNPTRRERLAKLEGFGPLPTAKIDTLIPSTLAPTIGTQFSRGQPLYYRDENKIMARTTALSLQSRTRLPYPGYQARGFRDPSSFPA